MADRGLVPYGTKLNLFVFFFPLSSSHVIELDRVVGEEDRPEKVNSYRTEQKKKKKEKVKRTWKKCDPSHLYEIKENRSQMI